MADARYDGFDAIEVLDEVDSTNEELMKRARAGVPRGRLFVRACSNRAEGADRMGGHRPKAGCTSRCSSNPRCRTGCYRAFLWHAASAWQTP